ncbi:TPA: hypothetical protein ACJRXO_001437 [Streptococcus agalactiae]
MAESANTVRSNSFVLEELTEFQREKLKNGESVKFNFSKDVKKGKKVIEGGQNLPNDGIVYLQPDKSLKSIDEKVEVRVPDVNGGYHSEHCVTNSYQKGY